MKFLVVLPLLFVACLSANVAVNLGGAGYNFAYHTGDAGAHSRTESGSADGSVSGSYSYVDAHGVPRTVNYRAGPNIGYQASGDISVDRTTAAQAAAIAAQAPKAPVAAAPAAAGPWYGAAAPAWGGYGWAGRW